MIRQRRLTLRLAAPAIAAVALFYGCLATMAYFSVLPSLGMAEIGSGFTLANYVAFLGDVFYLDYLWRSFRIAAYSTAIVLVLGYTVAYFMSLCRPLTRLVISLVLLVQFFTSYVIRTYAVVLLLSRNGVVNGTLQSLGLIDAPLQLLFTELAVAIGMVLIGLPLMVFPIYSSIAAIPANLRDAAESLGASRFSIFREIVLPLSLPGVSAGVTLVFLFTLTAFIMPNMLGGGYVDLVANLIYDRAIHAQDYPFATAVAMVSLVLTVTAVYLMQRGFSVAIRGVRR